MLVRRLLLEKYIEVNRVAKTNYGYIIVYKQMGGKIGEPGRIGSCVRTVYASMRRTRPGGSTVVLVLTPLPNKLRLPKILSIRWGV